MSRSQICLFVLVTLVLALGSSEAKKQVKRRPPPKGPKPFANVAAAAKAAGLTTFLSLVEKVPSLLAAATKRSSAITVFAPTDEAFKAALAALPPSINLTTNIDLLTQILSYHIAASVIPSSAVPKSGAPVKVSTLDTKSPPLTVSLVKRKVVIQAVGDNATVVVPDVKAGSAVVHVIDHVLLPFSLAATPSPQAAKPYASIAEAAEAAGLTTLLSLVKKVPSLLSAATDGSSAITVFAPTDDAFKAALAALPPSIDLNTDIDLLTKILSYHIVASVVPSSAVPTTGAPVKVSTLDANSPPLTVSLVNGKVVIQAVGDNATVVAADVKAGSAVVHVIDHVLLPIKI